MTDVWKSLPKKFCEICKVWYADNKISVENHERGLKHKSMVQQRLKDISRNAEKKDQERNALQYTLMQMETAALASVKGGDRGQQAAEAAAGLLGPQPRAAPSPAAERRKDAKDEAKERKRKLQELKKTAKKSQLWSDDADAIQWVKTETEDGQVYYWNIFTGGELVSLFILSLPVRKQRATIMQRSAVDVRQALCLKGPWFESLPN
ncbi:U1 zinc finger family protein [Aphelenchoides avenae]|nr:U1 zinc finger family protein [Aphelenchus avenae]